MRLRHSLLLSFLALLGGVLVFAGLQVHRAQSLESREAARQGMLRDLPLAALALDALEGVDPQTQVQRLSGATGFRVTLVDSLGTVLGDSHVASELIPRMENHLSRPEVMGAFESGSALEERISIHTGTQMLAGALRLEGADGPYVLRLGVPVSQAYGSSGPLLRWLLLAGLLGVALAVLLTVVLTLRITQPLSALTHHVGRMADGGSEVRVPRVQSLPELAPLSGALSRLADEIFGRVREVVRERDEMQGLIDSIAEGVIALTDDARVLRMNHAAEVLLGVPAKSVPFAPVGSMVRQTELRSILEESVVRPVSAQEVMVGDRSLLVNSRIPSWGGAVVTFLDVTDLRRMEQVRRDFVANASHELKTPLTAMRGFAETLLDGDPPDDLRREFLGSIRSNTLRLQALVDDLLDLSRLESGGWRARREEVDVTGSVREIWEEFLNQGRGAAIDFQVEGEALAVGDEHAIAQIFRNLLENALRYTPERGRIRVQVLPVGDEVQVSVTDSGSGIPSAALPRIFERFYRVDQSRARDQGGTGLGLAIVRHLVSSMGGEVGADSILGEGTTIWFTLPLVLEVGDEGDGGREDDEGREGDEQHSGNR
ncbi:MAG: ATP-binding protein [Gemmatimonadota bacterium]